MRVARAQTPERRAEAAKLERLMAYYYANVGITDAAREAIREAVKIEANISRDVLEVAYEGWIDLLDIDPESPTLVEELTAWGRARSEGSR